uniref:Putative salivary secreted mucin 3 n=1 Tax=Lutzomyia longipalpis TaxID=7200 RepID=A0A7G3AX83_LUTLO
MKLITSIFLIVSVTTVCVTAVPARYNPDDDAEVVVVPLEKQYPPQKGGDGAEPDFGNFDGVIEEDIPGGFFTIFRPFSFDFGSFFSNFEETLRQFREQVANSWGNGSSFGGADGDESDEPKGNTTSTVQIIDGHKVIVNETTYVKKSDFGTSIIKHRTVDVQPLDDAEPEGTTINPKGESTTKRDTEIEKDVESSEIDTDDNEISPGIDLGPDPQSSEKDENNELHDLVNPQTPLRAHFENFGSHESSSSAHKSHQIKSWPDRSPFRGHFNYFPKFSRNDFDKDYVEPQPIDLSDDIAINEMLADQGVAASNTDVEVFTVDNAEDRSFPSRYRWEYDPIK